MKFALQDLVDITLVKNLLDKINALYAFPSAIVNNEGSVLIAVGWQDVCTQFHRKNLLCQNECNKSDLYILEHLDEANPALIYRCPNGLVECVIPIIIAGQHFGNFFSGQFFSGIPDLDFFRSQAIKYGFDEQDYMLAVSKVPILTEEQRDLYLDLISGFIDLISGLGLKKLEEMEFRQAKEEADGRLKFHCENSPMAF